MFNVRGYWHANRIYIDREDLIIYCYEQAVKLKDTSQSVILYNLIEEIKAWKTNKET